MKSLFRLIAALTVAIVISGCAGRQFYLFSTGAAMITNGCRGALLVIKGVDHDYGPLQYGAPVMRVVFSGNSPYLITAQGYDANGNPLGSDSRTFSPGNSYTINVQDWNITQLQGGAGCQPVQRWTLLQRFQNWVGGAAASASKLWR